MPKWLKKYVSWVREDFDYGETIAYYYPGERFDLNQAGQCEELK